MLCNKIGTEQCDCVEWGRNWRLSCKDHVFPNLQNVQLLKIGMWKLLSKVSLEKGSDAFWHGQSGCWRVPGRRGEVSPNAKMHKNSEKAIIFPYIYGKQSLLKNP